MKNLCQKLITAATLLFLFSNSLLYSQIQVLPDMDYKFGEIIELKISEEVKFEDSLSIILTSFSHKRPFIGGSTKATAYIKITALSISKEITLSVHGIQGKSKFEDGLSDGIKCCTKGR